MSRASAAPWASGIGRSLAVRTATTPGTCSAADLSTLFSRAEAYGLRTKRVNSAPVGRRSLAKRVLPVRRSGESARRWRLPIWVKPLVGVVEMDISAGLKDMRCAPIEAGVTVRRLTLPRLGQRDFDR